MRGARSAWSRCSRTCSSATWIASARNATNGSARRPTRGRPALPKAKERMSSAGGAERSLLDWRGGWAEPRLRAELMEPRLERFIGVIYRPETERWSHYSEAILPRQFDAWVWFDETEAVTPLAAELRPGEAPSVEETYPFGL